MKQETSKEQIKQIKRLIETVDLKIKNAPEGNLHIRHCGTAFQFRIYYPGSRSSKYKEVYLSVKETTKLKDYGTKLYLTKLKQCLEDEIRLCMKGNIVDRENEGKVYDSLPKVLRGMITPLATSTKYKIESWYNMPFKSNAYQLDSNNTYLTDLNEKVRSRAECLIANTLNKYSLKYHYEEELKLQSGKRFYLDFKIAHPVTGEFYYIEFYGMMDNQEYALNAFRKIVEYSNDIVFQNMISIFDSIDVPFSNVTLNNIIKNVFLEK